MPGHIYVQLSPPSCHKLVSYGDTAIWLSQDAAVGTSSCCLGVSGSQRYPSPSASWNTNYLSSYWDRFGIMQPRDQSKMAESGDTTADRS